MNRSNRQTRSDSTRIKGWVIACVACFALVTVESTPAVAQCQCGKTWPHLFCAPCHVGGHLPAPADISNAEFDGSWYWMRSPEQERRVVMNIYNRYCIRCHGVDGRGVWDIPDVPDFTNSVWQATRPDAYRSRVIIEGRGAVMPPFRGTLTLEEACAMARYLHTFMPGTEVSRPGLGHETPESQPAANRPASSQPAGNQPAPPAPAPATPPPAPPAPGTAGPFNR